MNNPILKISSVKKIFKNEGEVLEILSDINLEVNEGSKIAIIGESGCGKTTLLNIIGGLDNPSSGIIQAGSFLVHALDEQQLAVYRSSYIGLVFQFHYLLKDFTTLENVMLPAYMSGISKKEAIKRAKALLNDVNLTHRLHHFPAQLSGGERQRAAVARALINEPNLILADEPTGNLDPANAQSIKELLFSIVSNYKKTLVLVTHDLEIAQLTDACYRLDNGRLFLQ